MHDHIKQPEQIFTPRAVAVNEIMYVERPDLEMALESSLRGSLNTVIRGESGTGKSWLYKRLLKKVGATYFPANLANASRMGPITDELANVIAELEPVARTGQSKTIGGDIGASGFKVNAQVVDQFQMAKKDPLELCFALARQKAADAMACIVLDNLESVFGDEKIMKELADIIILLDDERYSKHGVKLLIVGVPSGVKEYYANTPNTRTVSNRLYELPEVSRMTQGQSESLIVRGLIKELKFASPDRETLDVVIKHINWVTDRVPQRVHEYW